MDNQIQIQKYLANKEQLYQDWYMTYGQSPEPSQATEQVRAIPSTEGIKKLFAQFYSSIESILRQKICGDWCYCEKKSEYQQDREKFIAIIADVLSMVLPMPVNSLTTAVILYEEKFLDSLCACPKEIENNGPESE
ncbi:hypothetical protein QUF74_11915 [Candidatus Halobeggiatoa sp. HSG11]|nr:hypothetical protein [Candidatus Halobeggiatoa sp. HSG11]